MKIQDSSIPWPLVRKGKTHIATLNDSTGDAVSDHSAKAHLFLLAYK
jgi:hypothetical protein